MNPIPEKIEFTNPPPRPEDIDEWRLDRFARWLARAYRSQMSVKPKEEKIPEAGSEEKEVPNV